MTIKQTLASKQSAVAWHISSYSENGAGQCVEAGPLFDSSARFAVRDSRHRDHGTLLFPSSAWASFLTIIKIG